MRKRKSTLNFSRLQISNIRQSTGLSCIYHDQMDMMEQETTNMSMRIWIQWKNLAWAGKSSGWPLQQATVHWHYRQAKERPELSLHSFQIPFLKCWLQRVVAKAASLQLWQENLSCPNTGLLGLSSMSGYIANSSLRIDSEQRERWIKPGPRAAQLLSQRACCDLWSGPASLLIWAAWALRDRQFSWRVT